jgi:hypothetical protein
LNNGAKLLIPGLALFALLSVSLLYSGIGRLRATNTPPFGAGLYTVSSFIAPPPDALLLRLDRPICRWSIWALTFAVPVASAVSCFARERQFAALLLLVLWSILAGVFGFWIWLYSAFHALKV